VTTGPAQRGFTLLELIVAAGILALIAVFSWRGLDTLIREREAIAASQATIDVMQRSFARVERDAMLASDVQLDGSGAMRLVAGGASSIEGAGPATVEYRLESGTLTRSVVGVDRAPLVMIGGIASLTMEAWSPAPRGGGAWVATKGVAVDAPPPAPGAVGGPAAATPAPPGNPVQSPSTQSNGTVPPSAQAPAGPAPVIAAATGIRVSLALVDGSRIVRSFIVGGG
jgi:prepilin-type N-terminal cleavage/methylation domain-containing protein